MKSNDRPLGDVIREIMRKYKLEEHLEETKLIDNWSAVCGPMIAGHTTSINIRDHILFVRVDSAALRQELQYNRESLLSKLNRTAGKEIIRDIVFR